MLLFPPLYFVLEAAHELYKVCTLIPYKYFLYGKYNIYNIENNSYLKKGFYVILTGSGGSNSV